MQPLTFAQLCLMQACCALEAHDDTLSPPSPCSDFDTMTILMLCPDLQAVNDLLLVPACTLNCIP